MNIFESLYNCCNENTKSPFESYKDFTDKVETYCKQAKRNPKEEFLTQVFSHVMLKDDSLRKAFLEKLEIAAGDWKFWAEYSYSVRTNDKKKTEKGEMDVFGKSESSKSLLIIENKLDSEIGLEQPKKYAEVFNVNAEKAGYSEYTKYVVVLTKFSGLITYWNSYEGGIKEKIVSALQNKIDKEIGKGKYICKHIYWHEVYTLLENNFSNTEMQQELLVFLKSQNLDQEWHQDMGCPFWRKDFNNAYKAFAKKHNLPQPDNINKTTRTVKIKNEEGNEEEVIKPHLGIIKLSGTDDYFAGARIQGARAAEKSGNCFMLQLVVNGKAHDILFDENVEKCLKNCSDAILEAYGKK